MKYVAYYRVSTKMQGKSGLGLSAQRNDVKNFLKPTDEIIKDFTEIDSGKNNARVELQKAIDFCKMENATLLIAKLDRLSRNAAFIFKIKDSKVNFICCDMPDANTLTIGIFATLAQYEQEMISTRTKAALAARKAKGLPLGTPENLTNEARLKGTAKIKENARTNENNTRATALILSKMNETKKVIRKVNGKEVEKWVKKSLSDIANELNEMRFRTSKGKQFKKETVRRLYQRAIAQENEILKNIEIEKSKNNVIPITRNLKIKIS